MSRATLKTARSTPRADNGFILVTVLWLIAALAGLASIYSVYSVNSAVASRLSDDRLQAEAAVRAGVELAAYQAISALAAARPAHGAFVTKLAGETISVRYRSEAARIDVNAAPKELLAGLFNVLGLDPAVASGYVDHILAWRTTRAPNAADDAEAAAYKQAGLAYGPREAPFNDALELALVLGAPPAVVERSLPFVTVYSGQPTIDALDADPQTLSALPGMTPELLQGALRARARDPEDGQGLLKSLGAAAKQATVDSGKALRASILVELPGGRRVQAEVVFRLADKGEAPFDILYWRDDFDGPLQQG
jgi:general secretion pathway protein K